MDIWHILAIEETTDIKEIKRAYARKTKEIHPEENPEEFKNLYEAYQSALIYAKSFNNNLANIDIQMEEVYQETEADTLFINFYKELEELESKRNEALKEFKEIIFGSKWRDTKTWNIFVSSELFQSIKADSIFLMYVYNVLKSVYIKPSVAKILYYGLEYEHEYNRKWSHEKELYFLLYGKVNGLSNKSIRFTVISGIFLFVSILISANKLYTFQFSIILFYIIIYLLYIKIPLYKIGKKDRELQSVCKNMQGASLLPFGIVLFLMVMFFVNSTHL